MLRQYYNEFKNPFNKKIEGKNDSIAPLGLSPQAPRGLKCSRMGIEQPRPPLLYTLFKIIEIIHVQEVLCILKPKSIYYLYIRISLVRNLGIYEPVCIGL